jgi:spermidine synthase
MKKSIYLNLFLLSATVLCFEIVSTRISSLIFSYDYAFIILSLAIFGIGAGGIFSYYRIKNVAVSETPKLLSRIFLLMGASLLVFIVSIAEFSVTDYFVYFFLLLIPFFLAGIVYAQIFKVYAEYGFALYASDLAGAAFGSLMSIGALNYFGAPNAILSLAIVTFVCALVFMPGQIKKAELTAAYSILFLASISLTWNGKTDLLKSLPIGDFAEKDFYYVYPNAADISRIIDSRWSVYGRVDLVQYANQDYVRQMFIDGAAGTQMYRFDGNIKKPGQMLYNLLLSQTTTIPFLFLNEQQKNSMLDIGPGGGKEVLIGLFSGVKEITGVEVNPGFVDVVKKYRNFDGGIYDNFPNVKILIDEGRNYVKQTNDHYDLVVMSLPSTAQLQNIDNLAMSENYLLTVQAIKDYLKILTPTGELIFTVHNRLELLRLIITAMKAFHEIGISNKQAVDHFLILEQNYAPTIVIKKTAFRADQIQHIEEVMKMIPPMFPNVTYLPMDAERLPNTVINQFLSGIKSGQISVDDYVNQSRYNIEPCRDDSPYFYKLRRGVSSSYGGLLGGVAAANILVLLIPFASATKKLKKNKMASITVPLVIFVCIGLGFMIIEVTLFQKMVLFLGAPTISLSILLSSILVGMGLGSFYGRKIFRNNIRKRLEVICLSIIFIGILLFTGYPLVLNNFMSAGIVMRAFLSFAMLLPFGFLLGIPFPTALQFLKQNNMEQYVPWMYGINGTMSVLGSVLAVIFSMQFGFTPTFIVGLFFYFIIFITVPVYTPKK